MYYLRKLSNNPNLEKLKNFTCVGDTCADILKQEFATKDNTLSFWMCDDLNCISDSIKALLLSTTGIKAYHLFIVSDEILDKYGFKMDDTQPGITGYKGFEKLHINMTELTYAKIGLVIKMLNEVFQDSRNLMRIDRDKVKSYIFEVKNAGLLNLDVINEELLKDIDKYFNNQKAW